MTVMHGWQVREAFVKVLELPALSDVVIRENAWTAADQTCLSMRLFCPGGVAGGGITGAFPYNP